MWLRDQDAALSAPDPRSIPPASVLASRWVTRRSFAADQLADASVLAELKRAEGSRISAVVIASDLAAAARACSTISSQLMQDVELVDELIVLADPTPRTTLAPRPIPGARVVELKGLMPEIAPVVGYGEKLWRSLAAVDGDIVVWIDGDDPSFEPHMVTRLTAPLISERPIAFVRGYDGAAEDFEVEIDDVVYLAGGPRVTELLGRPLLNIFFPELGGFFQPLAGPSAGRVDVLRRIPMLTGPSVGVAMLIDLLELIGLEGLAQADLATGRRGSRSLVDLGPEAHAIMRTILGRAEKSHRIKLAPSAVAHPHLVRVGNQTKTVRIDEIERPPIDLLPPYLAALRSAGTNGDSRYAAARGAP